MKHLHQILIAFLLPLCIISCDKDANSEMDKDIILQVSENTVWQTTGSGIQAEYMLIKEETDTEWQKLPLNNIKGFEYEHGHRYELKVRIIIAAPSQDVSNCTYQLLEIISDIIPEDPTPDEWPDEAKFKLRMTQLKPFMDLDTPIAAPFDFLSFRILDNKEEYSFPEFPEYLHYYDSIVMTSPIMPDTYRIYENNAENTSSSFTSQWGSYFFEKNDFQICLKGYKDNKVKYETSITQVMRERDFLGIDWENGSITIANPKTERIYCVLDTRYEFLLTSTQLCNDIPYVKINVAPSNNLSDADNLKREKDGLEWLLKKQIGSATTISADEFKTLPEDSDIIATYENKSTRVAILHFTGNDLCAENYFVIAEPKSYIK